MHVTDALEDADFGRDAVPSELRVETRGVAEQNFFGSDVDERGRQPMQVCEHGTHAGIRSAACGRPIFDAHEGVAQGPTWGLPPQTLQEWPEHRISIGHIRKHFTAS